MPIDSAFQFKSDTHKVSKNFQNLRATEKQKISPRYAPFRQLQIVHISVVASTVIKYASTIW